MTVLVYGATAQQGRAIVNALLSQGHDVRTVSRTPEKAKASLPAAVNCVHGDLSDPASLAKAHDGIDTVVLTLPLVFDSSRFRANGEAALSAAERAGVRRLVYNTSVAAADAPVGDAVLDTIQGLSQRVIDSPVPALVLRPPLFLENLLTPWTRPDIEEAGVLRYPLPADLPARWISADTIGRAVAAAVASDITGKILDIADEHPLPGPDLAARLGDCLGRGVRYEAITPDTFAKRAEPWFGAEGARHLAELYRLIAAAPGIFDRDFAGARVTLGYQPVPSEDWLMRQFGSGSST